VSEPVDVSVVAVTFEDKSSDGDPLFIKEINDARRGFHQELKRMKPLLDTALGSPDIDSPAIFGKLKTQIEALPLEQSVGSKAFREGQRAAREDLLYDLQSFIDRQAGGGHIEVRRALGNAKERYDKRIDKGF
jgi:hypothetical protein